MAISVESSSCEGILTKLVSEQLELLEGLDRAPVLVSQHLKVPLQVAFDALDLIRVKLLQLLFSLVEGLVQHLELLMHQ